MLPPMLPLSAVPITSQQDPVRPRPDMPPVVPVQPSSSESTIDLQKRDPEEAAMALRDEQRRRQEQDKRRQLAEIRGLSVEAIADATRTNFWRLFNRVTPA
mgnify:CR=1 FL=1